MHPHTESEALVVAPKRVKAHEAVGDNGNGVSVAEADEPLATSSSENFEKLNQLLFMGQDYRIRGVK